MGCQPATKLGCSLDVSYDDVNVEIRNFVRKKQRSNCIIPFSMAAMVYVLRDTEHKFLGVSVSYDSKGELMMMPDDIFRS